MSSIRIEFLYLFALVLMHVASPMRAVRGEDMIQKVCSNTLYKDLCMSTLKADPASQSADVKGLALIAMKAATADGKDIYAYVAGKMKATNDAYLSPRYKECHGDYEDAIDRLNDSQSAMARGGYNDVNIWVSAAMSDANSCQDEFNDRPGSENTLVQRSDNFNKLCSNVLAITKQIQ